MNMLKAIVKGDPFFSHGVTMLTRGFHQLSLAHAQLGVVVAALGVAAAAPRGCGHTINDFGKFLPDIRSKHR